MQEEHLENEIIQARGNDEEISQGSATECADARKKRGGVRTKKTNNYRNIVLRYVFLVLAMLAFLAAIYGLVVSGRESEKESIQMAEHRVLQISSQTDTVLTNISKYYSVTAEGTDVESILKDTSCYFNTPLIEKYSDTLIGGGLFDDFVSDFTFIDTMSDYVVQNNGIFPKAEFPGYEEVVKPLTTGNEGRKFWSYTDPGVLKYIVKLPVGAVEPTALLSVEINIGKMRSYCAELLLGNEMLLIYGEDEIPIFVSCREELSSDSTKVLLSEGSITAKKEYKDPETGIRYKISSLKSNVCDWNYYMLYPIEKSVYEGIADALPGAFLIVIPACALFLIVIYLMYKPVDKLIKNVTDSENGEEAGSYNDFEYIEHKLNNLSADKSLLHDTVKRQQNSIQQMFELHLINDGIRSEDEWDEYFESLNLPKYEWFMTTVMVLDVRYDSHIQGTIDEDAICLQLIEDMPEDLRNVLWMPPVYNSCTIFSLIGAQDEDSLMGIVKDYYEKMQEYCKQKTGLYMLMGVSASHNDHRSIRLAYRESAMALMYNENRNRDYHEIEQSVLENGVDTSQSLRFYVEKYQQQSDLSTERYNLKYENDVQQAVREADTVKAYKTTDRFAEFLLTTKTTDDALFYILRYTQSIVMTALDSGISLNEIFPNGLRAACRELIAEIEPRRIRIYIKRFFIDPIISCMNTRTQEGAHHVMEMIDAVLDETHGNILLSECADRLGLSQNYIWKVLKMEYGKGFTEYAEKRKVEEAKKLLRNTSMSVQEIAAALDYANAQNFIRFFSKATGITPGKFRKMY